MYLVKINDGAYEFNAHYFGEHLENRERALSFTKRLTGPDDTFMDNLMPLVKEKVDKIEVFKEDGTLIATYTTYHYLFNIATDCPEFEDSFRGNAIFKPSMYS